MVVITQEEPGGPIILRNYEKGVSTYETRLTADEALVAARSLQDIGFKEKLRCVKNYQTEE